MYLKHSYYKIENGSKHHNSGNVEQDCAGMK